jgi:nitrite reductase/ring-hydroxylating ferredoxin subunit
MSWFDDDDLEQEPAGPTWYKVGPRDTFPEGRPRIAFAGTTRVLVLKIGEDLYAVKNSCPHAGGSLGLGGFNGKVVTCPRHDWRFNVDSSDTVTNEIYTLKRYPVALRDNDVWVEL